MKWVLLLTGVLVAGACAGGDQVSSEPSTSVELLVTENPWPAIGDELAAKLECPNLVESPIIVDAEWVLDCGSDIAGASVEIYLFESEAQRDQFMGDYSKPSQVIVGRDWAVESVSGSDTDQVALAVDGVVIRREALGEQSDPVPPVADPETVSPDVAGLEAIHLEAADLIEAGDTLAAVPLLNQVIANIDAAEGGSLGELRAWALIDRGYAYASEPRANVSEAAVSYQWLITDYGWTLATDTQETVEDRVIEAMFLRGRLASNQDDLATALEWFDQAIDNGVGLSSARSEVTVASAMHWKGVLLGQLGDTTAAVQILEEVLDRYGNHQDPDIQPIITGTRIELDYLTG